MKKCIILFLIGSFLLSITSFSYISNSKHDPILTRHDKEEAEFFKIAERFEKYMCHLNLPDCEGTIIADQWVLTAAHCAVIIKEKFEMGRKHAVIINGAEIEVDKLIMYKEWDTQHLDSTLSNIGLANDIALLHLTTKPKDAMQAKLYMDTDELDQLVYMLGRGSKGDGLIGINDSFDGKQRGATNRIETATEQWLTWTFDHPDTKTKYLTEYEGISGPGDSGGPAFILKNDEVYLAGVSSWQDTKDGPEGLYGVVENYTRVSQYIKWINEEMAGTSTSTEEMLTVEQRADATYYSPKAIAVSDKVLKQYVGEYEFQGITITIYKENSKLFISVTGQRSYEVIPTAEHKFACKILEGFTLEFEQPENNVFKELILVQPNGTFTAVRKPK